MRTCGKCGEQRIPFGLNWPYWHDGNPVCATCESLTQLKIKELAAQPANPRGFLGLTSPPKPLTEEDVRRIVREEIAGTVKNVQVWRQQYADRS